jgi:hypothetical protein
MLFALLEKTCVCNAFSNKSLYAFAAGVDALHIALKLYFFIFLANLIHFKLLLIVQIFIEEFDSSKLMPVFLVLYEGLPFNVI